MLPNSHLRTAREASGGREDDGDDHHQGHVPHVRGCRAEPAELGCVVCTRAEWSTYAFTAPTCTDEVKKPADEEVVALLISGGVRAQLWHIPAEALEPSVGPALELRRPARLRALAGRPRRRSCRRAAGRARSCTLPDLGSSWVGWRDARRRRGSIMAQALRSRGDRSFWSSCSSCCSAPSGCLTRPAASADSLRSSRPRPRSHDRRGRRAAPPTTAQQVAQPAVAPSTPPRADRPADRGPRRPPFQPPDAEAES